MSLLIIFLLSRTYTFYSICILNGLMYFFLSNPQSLIDFSATMLQPLFQKLIAVGRRDGCGETDTEVLFSLAGVSK